MTSGGARTRSGPAPDPNSGASERKGLRFRSLPPEGYQGEVPTFPLPALPDEDMSIRESELWAEVWTYPQAVAWADERWRWYSVAMWVRTAVACEQPDVKAGDRTSLLRLSEQIGLTTAGLSLNRWTIGSPEGEDVEKPGHVKRRSSRDRMALKVVNGGGR